MNINFNIKPVPVDHIISGSNLSNLFRLLRDNKFKIHKRYYPRLFKSIFLIVISIPFTLLEKLLYSHQISKVEVKSPVFILGYPRSGTTNLIYLLSKDPAFAVCKTYEVLCPHMLFTFGKVIRKVALKALPKSRPMDNMPLGADLPKEEEFAIGNIGLESMANAIYFPGRFSDYCKRFVLFSGNDSEKRNWKKNHLLWIKKLTFKNKGKTMLLKSPFDTGRVKEILELYPDARFIHIFREPVSLFYSNLKLYEGILPQASFQEVSNDEMKDHIFFTYKATYQKYLNEKKMIPPGNLYELSYEQFNGNELSYLEHMYRELGLGDFELVRDIYNKALKENSTYKPNVHKHNAPEVSLVREEWGTIAEKIQQESNVQL